VARVAFGGRPGDVWDHALAWFGPSDDDLLGRLADAEIVATRPDELRDRLRAQVDPVLAPTGLAAELVDRPIPWDRWDPGARRLRAS